MSLSGFLVLRALPVTTAQCDFVGALLLLQETPALSTCLPQSPSCPLQPPTEMPYQLLPDLNRIHQMHPATPVLVRILGASDAREESRVGLEDPAPPGPVLGCHQPAPCRLVFRSQ